MLVTTLIISRVTRLLAIEVQRVRVAWMDRYALQLHFSIATIQLIHALQYYDLLTQTAIYDGTLT